MSQVNCPHCQAQSAPGDFCESCGMALPGPAQAPRIIADSALAGTAAGAVLQSQALGKQVKKAAQALLVVAVIQSLGAIVFTLMMSHAPAARQAQSLPGLVVLYVIASLFWALYIWACWQPLPAAITGIIFFVSLHLLDAMINPASLASGIIIKVMVIAMFIKAIDAGLKCRKLERMSLAPAQASLA